MDMAFRWMNDSNREYGADMAKRDAFRQELAGANEAFRQDMQRQAELARLAELEKEFEGVDGKSIRNMQIASMLAMAGQPGALQGLLMNGNGGGSDAAVSQAQSDMDNLEKTLAESIYAMAGADEGTFLKGMDGIIPLFRSKFDELLGKGAHSRMGDSWDSGWGERLKGQLESRKARKKAADDRKHENSGLGW